MDLLLHVVLVAALQENQHSNCNAGQLVEQKSVSITTSVRLCSRLSSTRNNMFDTCTCLHEAKGHMQHGVAPS
jgi:hypothetical protein